METINPLEQNKSRHWIVPALLVMGMFIVIVKTILCLRGYWEWFEVAGWEFEPLTYRKGVPETYKAVKTDIFLLMVVALVSGACLLFFFVRMLMWKKSGFLGFAITMAVTAVTNLILAHLICNGFAQIEVEIGKVRPVLQLLCTALTTISVWAVLQIRKDGVSCWRQME